MANDHGVVANNILVKFEESERCQAEEAVDKIRSANTVDAHRTLLEDFKDIFDEMVPRNNDLREGHDIQFDDFEPENMVYPHPGEVHA
ncbi:hypothetical protein LTR10_020324 [Elasticomyces elasticus]|uniref:Inhibitor I9 domain-containing protein n=1 Tax=Exophiala sideris TaxID=1016849 RepID=A0ABR0J7L5_9EURO|nr:hypothetical protein LTR10_020324 [Elasticomyces elasticus]KAK5029981.1 hypothetical protein LTS07_005705 [Exophiala sideris]KAK5058257.1 hypothetical protein LTR69_006661 [Exophiala sideris]